MSDILLINGIENKKFKLSDKIFTLLHKDCLPEKDVKEFIRLLKEEFEFETMYSFNYILRKIDKLSGDLKWLNLN